MKKHMSKMMLAALTALLLLSFAVGCDPNAAVGDEKPVSPAAEPAESKHLELLGAWDDGYGTVKTFTDSTFDFDAQPSQYGEWDYSGDVVSFDNSNYNIPSENPSNGDFGHMVLKITAHKADATQVGTYTVIRWKEIVTADGKTTVNLSEAYPAGWTTAAAAKAEANEAKNFATYSSHTKIVK